MKSQIAFEIQPELKERLKKFSDDTGMKMKVLLGEWIEEKLDYYEGMNKQAEMTILEQMDFAGRYQKMMMNELKIRKELKNNEN